MRFFVTGVGGQLGHDVMNELLKRGHEGVGSDIQECYSGAADGSAVTRAPYRTLDITDREAVHNVIAEIHPDGRQWIWQKMKRTLIKCVQLMQAEQRI